MKRKYAPGIQHTIYKDGWKDALHEVGKIIDDTFEVDSNSERRIVYVDRLEEELGRLVEGLLS